MKLKLKEDGGGEGFMDKNNLAKIHCPRKPCSQIALLGQ